ncbi:glutathionylspermidine synthase [Exiguobacterium sp. KRL4]|uniref:glutathionylspermidine synthase family protein n=1 Tax=Exiguobacterium sp. KRL4 TaxID=1914536 RepID=UPI0008F8D40B|nr:glutathionylspermidine synthase family protein [Exiguobacterium sp. KRL4]OIN67571.1 glutathionylspermidine synthase [Exiguobacterium sp. KRL4]
MNERQKLYGDIESFWDLLDGDIYALTEVMPVSKGTIENLRLAARDAYSIFEKVIPILWTMDDQGLLELGFPEAAVPFLRLQTMRPLSVISRFDFIVTGEKISVMEWNADTPTFIKESFEVNDRIAEKVGLQPINPGQATQLAESVCRAVDAAAHRISQRPHVVFTSHGDNIEDRLTTEYLQQFVAGAGYCPLDELEIRPEDGLYDQDGKRIDILYRQTFPIEMALLDRDEDGKELGALLLQLVEMGLLEIINPPSAFLMQAKSVLALIWLLHESKHAYLTDQEHEIIERYFLPTYLSPASFLERRQAFVEKPIFGREGDTVTIHQGNGDVMYSNEQRSFADQSAVYQRYQELPTWQLENGTEVAYMFGVFVLGGQPSAVGVRAGERITGNRSYFLPIGQQEHQEEDK